MVEEMQDNRDGYSGGVDVGWQQMRCGTMDMAKCVVRTATDWENISSADVFIHVVLHLRQHACPPLYSPLTLYAIPTSCVSIAVLIALYSIVPCTLPLLFVYLLRSDLLLYLHSYVLHCLL